MSSPRSLFEIQTSDIFQGERIDDNILTTISVAATTTVEVGEACQSVPPCPQITKCEVVTNCCEPIVCCKPEPVCPNIYHYWGIVLLALIAIFVINYIGNRCHNYDWFNKHIHKCDWIAYGETMGLWWSILLILFAYAALRLFGGSCGKNRNILMILYVLILVLSAILVYSTFELRNFQTAFLIGILLIVIVLILLWYSWKVDYVATAFIILFIIWLIYFTVVNYNLECQKSC